MREDAHLADDTHLYNALIAVIEERKGEWVSSHDIINHPRIKPFVDMHGAKRPSNYLGNLFRRSIVKREGASLHGCLDGSRYVYSVDAPEKSTLLVNKANLKIADDGKYVVIDTPSLRVTIEQK